MEKEKYECKECCSEISKQTFIDNDGLCYNCYKESEKEINSSIKEETCPAVTVVRFIAILDIIGAIVMCLMGEFAYIQSIVLGILLYAFGEVIKLLFDIKILLKKNNKD